MIYRRFGRTNWQLSEIGYGMWGMGGWKESDDENVFGDRVLCCSHASAVLDKLGRRLSKTESGVHPAGRCGLWRFVLLWTTKVHDAAHRSLGI